jgi:pimeloyl-ACP methyl ester carboxylesterase
MAEKSGWTEQKFKVGESELQVLKAGSGKPLLILHGELGNPGWLKWHAALAEKRTLCLPLHPGFGVSPLASWIMNIRDLAIFYSRFVREQGMKPVDVIGFSLGGWIAAEMAINNAQQFNKMILVGATGMRPPTGEIMDLFTVTARTYLNRSVVDTQGDEFKKLFGGEQTPEQFEAWEDARAETARLAWQPYMFNLSMQQLCENIAGLPALLLWGKQDAVVPTSVAEAYNKQIAGSKLVTFDKCGHMPEVEKPDEFIKEVTSFLG